MTAACVYSVLFLQRRSRDVFRVLLVRGPNAGTWVRVRVATPAGSQGRAKTGIGGDGKVEAEGLSRDPY